jgi:Fe-S-cluster containining protein
LTASFFSNCLADGELPLLPEEDRFVCLPGCGLCCSYRVLVSEADRQRLGSVSPPSDHSGLWETSSDGTLALQRGLAGRPGLDRPGFCLFLDQHLRCGVYERRPDHCRVYPYLWTGYHRQELDVDLSCPGLGCGEVIPAEWRQPPTESAAQQAQRKTAIDGVRELLRAQQRYADPEALTVLGGLAVDELATRWAVAETPGAVTLGITQAGRLSANLESGMDEALPGVWESLLLAPRSVEALIADDGFVERNFARPRWNTRPSPAGEVTLYCFWVVEGILYVEQRGGVCEEIPLDDIGQVAWTPEAILTRRAYLERWLKRQLPVRLANNLGLARPWPGVHVATCYLEFLVEIDWRLAVLAPALARVNFKGKGKRELDREIVWEAIRGSDGLLRAWCESARVGVAH